MNDSFIPLHDPRFRYTPAAQTDVTRTWRRQGWVPPTEADPERFRRLRQELNGLEIDR